MGLRVVAAAVALALAVVLAFLARDVRAWQESVERGDRSFQVAPGADGLWEPEGRTVPGDLARTALGLDDDLLLREAAQLSRRSRPRSAEQRTVRDLSEATAAQAGFGALQQDEGAPRRLRSIAANELGVLFFADVISNPDQAAQRSQRALQKFVEAIRLDGSNRAAMANLELMLTLLRADDPRVDPEGVEQRGGGSAAGAGGSSGGRGF
jgi:hypothetical protein